MSNPKILIILTFVILLLAGFVNLLFRNTAPLTETSWNAVHPLKKNHQLIAKDLKKSTTGKEALDSALPKDLIGKHLTVEKNTNDKVEIQELSDVPQITEFEDNHVSVIYSLPEKQIANLELIDVSSKIKICATKTQKAAADASATTKVTCTLEPVEVLAIHRKTSELSEDWLMLKVHSTQQEDLTAIMTSDKQVLLIVKNN